MRPRIVDLRVDEIEWAPLGPPGLYSRLLSRDEETGARTALQRLAPQDGYSPPQVAHYHHTYEELLGVSGCFSFDSRNWVRPGSYLFHPPRTVHGFASAIREESTFLSRVGRDLDFNFVEQPEHDDLYVVEGAPPPRAPVAIGPEQSLEGFGEGDFLGAPAQVRPLSVDPQIGEGSAFVKLPKGWKSEATKLDYYLEIFVMEGGLGVDGGDASPRRSYFFYPPGEPINAFEAGSDTLAYVNFGELVPQ